MVCGSLRPPKTWLNTDVEVRLSALGFLSFFICTHALQLNNFSFSHDTNGHVLRPIPGDIISVSMKTENNDPSRVDLNLYNIDLGNETTGLSSLDPVRNADVGFEIPWVPPG